MTKQRVRVEFGEVEIAEAESAVRAAWQTARAAILPPPLLDSPRCLGCSLVPICLPDEVNRLNAEWIEPPSEQLLLFAANEALPPRKSMAHETRRLLAPRDDLRPAHLNTQGLRVGKSGLVLQVKEKDPLVQAIRMNEICQLNLMGSIQLSTQAVQALCDNNIPICYFSVGGWCYGITTGLCTKNVFLRQRQFAARSSHGSASGWHANWWRERFATNDVSSAESYRA